MTLVTKGLMLILFSTVLLTVIALLPSATCDTISLTGCYPLPTAILVSLNVIFGYTFAWATVFNFIIIWFALALISIGFEALIWVAKKVVWIIGLAARLLS
jgi:hypothetical protein